MWHHRFAQIHHEAYRRISAFTLLLLGFALLSVDLVSVRVSAICQISDSVSVTLSVAGEDFKGKTFELQSGVSFPVDESVLKTPNTRAALLIRICA